MFGWTLTYDPVAARNRRLKAQFGLEAGEWEIIWLQQGEVCAICGKAQLGTRCFATDHDHKTGATRGLICHRCNRLLGWAFDDPEILESAANYLRDPPAPRILGRVVQGLTGRVTKKRKRKKRAKGT